MTSRTHRLAGAVFALPLWLCGCLEPAADGGLYSSYVLPADYRVPYLEEDQAAAKKLDANDGFGTAIPLRTGFAGGNEVQYWDLGQLTATTLRPMYIFLRPQTTVDAGTVMQDEIVHPDLIDSIPGDMAYSPLRQIFTVYVTDRYRGERITSIRALEDAAELGLVTSPAPSEFFVNCAVVAQTVQIQVTDDGSSTVGADAYYRGRIVKQFCAGGLVAEVGAIKLNAMNSFTPGNAYVLRRQSEQVAVDETALKLDLNDDGDLLDTNNVFDAQISADASTYTGVWKSFDVVVARSFKLGDAKTEADLFQRTGSMLVSTANVLDFKDSGVFLNRPQRFSQR